MITYSIETDEDPWDPREWDNLGTMVCWHNRYTLGDEQPKSDPETWRIELAMKYEPDLDLKIEKLSNSWNSLGKDYQERSIAHETKLKRLVDTVLDKHVLMLPLYLYDHSGITMSTSGFNCRWDSGKVGYIYADLEKFKKEFGWTQLSRQRKFYIATELTNEVKTYDQFLTGEVYRYTVQDDNGDCVDSCGGFYSREDAEAEAKSSVASQEKYAAEQVERATFPVASMGV